MKGTAMGAAAILFSVAWGIILILVMRVGVVWTLWLMSTPVLYPLFAVAVCSLIFVVRKWIDHEGARYLLKWITLCLLFTPYPLLLPHPMFSLQVVLFGVFYEQPDLVAYGVICGVVGFLIVLALTRGIEIRRRRTSEMDEDALEPE